MVGLFYRGGGGLGKVAAEGEAPRRAIVAVHRPGVLKRVERRLRPQRWLLAAGTVLLVGILFTL